MNGSVRPLCAGRSSPDAVGQRKAMKLPPVRCGRSTQSRETAARPMRSLKQPNDLRQDSAPQSAGTTGSTLFKRQPMPLRRNYQQNRMGEAFRCVTHRFYPRFRSFKGKAVHVRNSEHESNRTANRAVRARAGACTAAPILVPDVCPPASMAEGSDTIPCLDLGNHAAADPCRGSQAVLRPLHTHIPDP